MPGQRHPQKNEQHNTIQGGLQRLQTVFFMSLFFRRYIFMADFEKELLQARHRLEEAQARKRVKERKARTRRLIQEGAILEKALPQTMQMTLEQLETFLCEVFKAVR